MLTELETEDRKIKWLERFLIAALACLIAYVTYSVYCRNWNDLIGASIPVAASLSALLIAATATRLIKFNQVQRSLENCEDRRCEIQNAMIVVDEIRGRLNYIKECHVDMTKPLVGIQKAIEEIENLYMRFLSKEATGLLPADSAAEIYRLSGSIFGLSVGVARIVAYHKNEPETTIFLGDLEQAPEAVKSIDEMDLMLNEATESLDKHYRVLAENVRA